MKLWFLCVVLMLMPVGSANGGERFACNLRALTKDERTQHAKVSKKLLDSVQETKELEERLRVADARGLAADRGPVDRARTSVLPVLHVRAGTVPGQRAGVAERHRDHGREGFIKEEFGL
jgi:hypothetical protein